MALEGDEFARWERKQQEHPDEPDGGEFARWEREQQEHPNRPDGEFARWEREKQECLSEEDEFARWEREQEVEEDHGRSQHDAETALERSEQHAICEQASSGPAYEDWELRQGSAAGASSGPAYENWELRQEAAAGGTDVSKSFGYWDLERGGCDNTHISHRFEDDFEIESNAQKRQKVNTEEIAQLFMEVEEQRSTIAQLREELSVVEREAATLGARYLTSGGVPGVELTPKLERLLADARANNNLNVKDEVFLEHFFTHIAHPNAPYCELVSDIAKHYANCLGAMATLTETSSQHGLY
jgi:hypothetical protein